MHLNTVKLKTLTLALLATGLVAQPLIANAAPRATATNLGSLGGTYSYANAINDNGQVAGYSAISGNTAQHAFLYSNGSMTDLGTLGGSYSSAYAINASGQVVGYTDITGNLAYRAFRFSNGSMTDLGTLGGTYSTAFAINASGQVAGYAKPTGNSAFHAFIYSNGSMTDLGTLGGTASTAYAINDNGQVAGSSNITGNTAQHAFLYSNGSMTDLGTLGGTSSEAHAINASRQVVGYAYTTGNVDYHAFLYSNGSMTDLRTLGGSGSQAHAINASGQVVGMSNITGDTAQHAFLFNNGTLYDLNSLAPNGVTYYEAKGINRYAQIAVNGSNGPSMLTLHPDWQGGNGYWDDVSHWNYAGMGSFGFNPGAPHDVVINPTGSATVYGSYDATVRSLSVGGNAGQIVTLNLNGGSTATTHGTTLNANGVLAGSGRLAGGLTTAANSNVNIKGGESTEFTAGAVINNGKINVLGVGATPAILNFASGLSNNGQLNVSFGTGVVFGNVTTSSGGKIILTGNSNTAFYDAVDIKGGGELRVSTGSSATFFGQVYQRSGSIFSGSGTKFYEGGLSVGASPGLGIDSGNVSFGDGSVYLAEIGGLTAGTRFDHYTVGGSLTFGGTLQLVSWEGFTGQAGQSFDLFDWGTTNGAFSNIDSTAFKLAAGTKLDTSLLYTRGVISVQAVPEPESYAMLLAGLGLMGFVARCRKSAVCKAFV